MATKNLRRQYASITLQGALVEPAQVLTQGPTEWPKVGAIFRVQHGPDQQTLFFLTAVGPLGDQLLDAKVGKEYQAQGQLKASTGKIEVFLSAFGLAQDARVGYVSLFSPFTRPDVEGDEWKKEDGEDE